MTQITRKIVLCGHFGVGKTSLINQFIHARFSEKYITTIGVTMEKKTVTIDSDEEVTFIIWDLAGESETVKMNPAYLKGSHGAIYVFDVSRPETFQTLSENVNKVMELIGRSVPLQVVGNKKDLLKNEEEELEVLHMANHHVDALTSAKTGEEVENVFMNLAKAMLQIA